jgi:hypothetical protein
MGAKRPVAPDTPIRSFPTPNVEDLVVVVDVDSRLPGYKPLDYGTPHPDQTRFQGAKLVYQEPLDGSDQFVRRIYATDRSDQDAYNYAIKYSSGSPGHPVYIRTYVEPRASYTPLADGSPDSVFPDAFLVEEEMQPVEGELNSLYVKVSRVFETLPGPVLTSFETNEAGQKVTVTTQRKSSAGYSLPAASATSSPSAQAEDAGVVTEQVRKVPSIFTRKQFSAERPDMLPQKFRAAVPDVETSELVPGTAEQPTLLQGDISASQTQQSLFVKQVSRRSRTSPTYPRVITETTATRSGQLATVTSTLDDSIQTADTGPLVESSEVTDLGDGRSIKVTTEVDEVFDQPSFTRAKEDLTPPKFRATVTETVEERTIPGTAAMPASLSGDEISRTEEQLTLDRKRVRTQERAIGTTSTLNEFVLTPEGQLATRTLTLSNQPQTVTPSATLLQGEIEQLGDGRTVRTVVTVPSVFDERRVAKEKPDLVPQEFRGAIPTETTEVVQTGTTATMPTLEPGELARTEQRITANKVRTSVTTRPSTALPVTLTPSDTLVDNDGVSVARVKTLASGEQTFTPSATVSGSVESIGDGLTVRTVDTKSEVFGSQTFSKERPENIPVEFRATVPETVTEVTEPGEAEPVTLIGNERAKTEQQVTKFTKRTRTVTRDFTTSGALEFGEQVDQDGVKISVVRTLSEGAQPISPSATVSGTVEDLGDGKTVQTLLTKEEVFGSQSFAQEKPETVPAEFRATVPDSVTEVTEPGVAEPITLSGNEISKTEQQVTKFTKRTRTVTRNATTSGVLDLGEQVDNDGVKVSVVRTLAQGAQPITPSATISGTVEDIGDGKTVRTLLTKAEVFGSASFVKAKEDLTPQKFRASIAEEVVEQTVPGTAVMPTSLTPDEFEKSEQQVNKFLKRTRTRVRQLGENKVLTESVVTPTGQLASRTLILSDQPQTVSPSATLLEGSIEELGDGRTVKTEVSVASIFDERRLAVEKPDLVPQEFRGAVPTQTSEVVETGTSISMPTLSAGELARARQRITEHKVRTSVTTRPVSSLPVTLTPSDTLIDNDGVVVTRVKTLASGSQSLAPSATVSGSVENIGDGLTIKTEDTKAEVFTSAAFTRLKEDLTPTKFKASVAEQITESTGAGTAAMPGSLSPNEFEKSEQQVNKFTKRTRTRTRDISESPVLEEQVITNNGQLATRRLTLLDQPQTIQPSATIVSGEVEELGDGRTVKTEVEVPSVFENKSLELSAPDVTPEKFRAALPTFITESTTAGTVSSELTLSGGEVSKSEAQQTEFTKRTRVATRDPAGFATLSGGTQFTGELGGGTASVVERYGDSAYTSIVPGFGTVSFTKEELGDGKFVSRHVALADTSTLSGQVYDEQLDIIIPFTTRVVAPANANLGTNRLTVQPDTVLHSTVRELNVNSYRAAVLAQHYQLAAYVNVELPDRLIEVTAISVFGSSTGSATSTGSSWSIEASGTGSNTIDMRWRIKNGYTGPVPATRHIFFLDKTDAGFDAVKAKVNAAEFPSLFPEPVTITAVGGSVTRRVNSSASFDISSGNNSTGSGESFSNTLQSSITTIPPTLHGQINITTETVNLTPFNAGGGTLTATAPSFTGRFSPSSIPATAPHTSFPAGSYIISIDTESWRYGLVRVTALVAHIGQAYVN